MIRLKTASLVGLCLFFCSAVFCALILDKAMAAEKPQLLKDVELQNCSACHGAEAVLPDKHVDVKKKENSDCTKCHTPEKDSLRGKMPLSHTHMLSDVGCGECHDGDSPEQAVKTEKCRDCHGEPAALEALTKDLEYNPHVSPHYGNDMDCDMCHHLHKASENVCLECHELTVVTP